MVLIWITFNGELVFVLTKRESIQLINGQNIREKVEEGRIFATTLGFVRVDITIVVLGEWFDVVLDHVVAITRGS